MHPPPTPAPTADTDPLAAFALPPQSKVLVVTDIVESVRLMELDEAGTVARWHALVKRVLDEVLPPHGGRMVKSLGDGLMLEFPDARAGAEAAFAIRRISREANAGLPPERQMHLRIGVHRAEFVRDDHDIYGIGVNLTARVAAQAGPGEVVATVAVRDELAEGLDADLEDLGECYLKHVSQPVRIYRLEEPGAERPEPTAPTDGEARKPTVAVIPFDARSTGEHHFAIGELIADHVIAQLSRTPDLRVISRLSATVFRGRDVAPFEIERHLGAHYLLHGSYVASGDKLLVMAELADAQSGEVRWSKRLNAEVGDLLQVESELSHELASAAHNAILDAEVQKALSQRLPTLQSHSLMLGAVTLMHRTARNDFFRAQDLLNLLLERHPRHAELLAWLAKWHVLQVEQGWSGNVEDTAKRALGHTNRALDIDGKSALALTMDGFVRCNLLKDFDGALDRYRMALQLNPNESLAWLFMGMLHGFTGQPGPALAEVDTALALSPLDPARYFFQSLAASIHLSAGQYDRAVELARSSLKSNTTHISTHRALTIALAMAGRIEEARMQATRLMQLAPEFTVSVFRARRQGGGFSEQGRLFAEALRMAGVPE
ncbi:adenylate/guanylate cyclase domain-containing protein [Ramlibacter albus]|uniref:Guanylate cyclase domain-containing protein n=1 Tax=Ramlibacter albus TaxID=2079448 RepID=A0A923S0M6_9BURK|nr:adenylate/guanylate cyclase domain-containing protein [Ramlibacter albus]MBC5763371.1 hypothetical protein [Ramlibacter albus]